MTSPRLRSLSVKGFRAFGAAEQTLNLPGDIAVVWGPNSTGKTSLAEAFEFLLTGRISRRELMASSQDEFADALRNAHLTLGEEVFVAARIIATDGTPHEIRRVLTRDYGKRHDCASQLEVDGAAADEDDLAKLGIVLSQPPLEAPVLSQHTISYIFSVRPQDRATYFKTLLELTDLDDIRNDIAALAGEFAPPDDPLLSKFNTCAGLSVLQPFLAGVLAAIPSSTVLATTMKDAAHRLVEAAAAGEIVPDTLDERLAMLDGILSERRNTTFPVREFERREFADWSVPAPDIWARLETYLAELKRVGDETRWLVGLFGEALRLPAISGITESVDCPLCGGETALTVERVQFIRRHAEDSKGFRAAEIAAKSALSQLSASAAALVSAVEATLPGYLKATTNERRETGFTVARIRELLGDRADELMKPWLGRIAPLARAGAALRRGAQAAGVLIQEQEVGTATGLDLDRLRATFSTLDALRATYAAANADYQPPAAALRSALNGVLDVQSDTVGWQDFLDIAREQDAFRILLIERATRVAIGKELEAALRQIDRAKERVLDDKFSDFSSLIQVWWQRLRPHEPTFFSAVRPREGAKRTIDFKAGLSVDPNRSSPKVRDVIAVFSQSQLHCLGLAMFLARAQQDGLGFVILDDPVLSSDEDYRIHFNSTVLSELLELPTQVVVLTKDHDTWEEIESRYRHLGISNAQLLVDTPAEGSVIENTGDTLTAKLNRAKSLARSGHPDGRKACGFHLRDAGERFCKDMLVNQKRRSGDVAASLTDYDGKTLEWLCPRVQQLLDHDPSHSGKLEVFKNTVNKACHDNVPPSNDEMIQAHGELRYLVKQYLGR